MHMPGKTQHYPSHHNIDNHTVGASSGRVLIENLDSVMQRKLWDDTLDGRVNTSNPAMFWNKTPSPEGCTAIVHNNPKLVERFAGILRTSFLYCPQILLTDAELFDGIFLPRTWTAGNQRDLGQVTCRSTVTYFFRSWQYIRTLSTTFYITAD
jgi:hypothetical protein